MKSIYNHIYNIKFRPGIRFNFQEKRPLINLQGYESVIYSQLPNVVEKLTQDRSSRQAVITVCGDLYEPGACLISLQFQIDVVSETLIVTANFRSQCEKLGRPHDELMICSVVDQVRKYMKIDSKKVKITCNVGNYHINPMWYEMTASGHYPNM